MGSTEANRLLAEKGLQDKENIYKFLLDNSREIILILSKSGKILLANKAALNSFGYSEGEILGKSITRFLTKDSIRKSLYALAQEFVGQAQPEMEVKAKTKLGELRYLRIAMGSAPIYDQEKLIGLMVCGSDITELRKREQELERTEKRFRELWDKAPVAYHTLDANGMITDVNETEARMLGYKKEQMVGKSIFTFILPEQQAEAQKRFQQKISGQKISKAESRMYVRKDGAKIYVSIDDVLERDKSGKIIGVWTTMVDVTEQKEIEAALKESERRYKDLVEKAGIAILIDDEEGNFKYVNERYADIFGYSVEEMRKQSIRSVVHPEDVARVMAYHKGRLQGKNVPSRYEFKGMRKDGSFIYLEVDSVALREGRNGPGTSSYLWDITERKKAVEALWESEEKFRNLAEQSPNMIFINRQGRVVYANKRCEEITGYKREEIYSPEFDFRMMIAPESRDMVIANFSRHLKGFEVSSYEYVLLTKGGKRIDAILATKLTNYENEKAILGIVTDITKQKKADKIRDSVYRISEAAHSAQNLEDLFRLIHEVIRELMPANNFYISLYDYNKEILSFPYFADEYDETPAPKRLGKGLTEYVLRSGEPLLASPEVFDELVRKGEVESIGTPSIDWLGVPLKAENKVFGVLVVQSYVEGIRFGEEEKEILKFVSDQIAMAIKRKHAEEQLKKSLREKETLLQEIHHRVKNNMQIISSLLNLQANQIKDDDFVKIIKVCQSRIRSMALVHEKLYLSRDLAKIDFSDYVESLIAHLFQFNQVSSDLVHLKLNLEDVFLDIQTAIPCGLILNELVTNSLKHAFPEGRGGEIVVEMHPLEQHAVQIVVKDNGRGLPQDLDIKRPIGMGLQIVNMLVNQLEGSIEVQRNGGAAVKIVIKESIYKSRI